MAQLSAINFIQSNRGGEAITTVPHIIDGRLHAPYFLYLRCSGRFSDRELLDMFRLANYRPADSDPHFRRHAFLSDFDDWTLLADDWHYSLWHLPSTRPILAQLGQLFDVFACSVGDCDESFDFEYHHAGQLRRRYTVASPHFSDRVIFENIGEPLPGEADAFHHTDATEITLTLAASLGLKTRFEPHDFRIYVSPTR